jgi:hypothetical protein
MFQARFWTTESRWRELTVAIVVGLTCVVGAWRMFGMHRGDLNKPVLNGDGFMLYGIVKGMQQHGWYTPNSSLGFPGSQDWAPFPTLDLVHLLTLKAFSVFSSNPYAPVTLFELWGFFIVGLIGYLVMRYVGVRLLIAVPLALSLSLAPWHFQRLIGHDFLANYSSLLVAVFVAIFVLRRIRASVCGLPLFTRSDIPSYLLLIACGFYIAGGGLYWAFAAGCMITLTIVPALAVVPSWRGLVYTIMALVPTAMFGAIWLKTQTWMSSLPVVVKSFNREFIESELYGGSLSTLVLVSPQSGIAPLAHWRVSYDSARHLSSNIETGPWNSLIGVIAIAFSLLCIFVAFSTLLPTRPNGESGWQRHVERMLKSLRAEGWIAAFFLVLLMFTVTGIGTIAMLYFFNEIRAWGRFFMPLLILATIILGLGMTSLSQIRPGRLTAIMMAVALGLIFIADQARGDYRRDFVRNPAIAADAASLVKNIEATVKPGCGILTLPVLPFPENGPIGGMLDYDPYLLYLPSSTLRFTYGQPKNQPEARWQDQFVQPLTAVSIAVLKQAGACGITIDTAAYGGPDAPIVSETALLTARQPLRSPSGRWVFFPIT